MHPILWEIPLNYWTAAFVGLFFAAGGVIRARFAPADRDASYLATFLGLNVKWNVVQNQWPQALVAGLGSGGAAFAVVVLIREIANDTIANWADHTAQSVTFLATPLHALGRLRFGATTIPLHIYGLMMASAFIVGIWLAMREAIHQQLPQVPYLDENGKQYVDKDGKKIFLQAADVMSDLAFYLLVAGLGGARLLYIFTRWDSDYSGHPERMFMFWQGGLVWYGGLIGATLVSVWFIRKHKIAFLPYGDAIVPGVSLAHAVGRLGCFAAGCCFGNVAIPGFPLAVQFPPGSPAAEEHLQVLNGPVPNDFHGSLSDYVAHYFTGYHPLNGDQPSAPVYPTQIMEALGEVIIFLILLKVRTRKRFHGQVLMTYFFLYPILRVIMEMFRGDTIRGFFFRWPSEEHPMLMLTSQGVSVAMALVGGGLTIWLVGKKSRADAA